MADATTTPADAHTLFEQGLEWSRSEQWVNAREAYIRSLALEPRPSTYFNLAAVSLKLRLGRATLLALDEFARRADRHDHAEFIAESIKLRERASAMVGTLELAVDPAQAEVRIDDDLAPLATGGSRLVPLDLGHHVVRATLHGYRPWVGTVRIATGDNERLSIELTRSDAARAVQTPSASTAAQGEPSSVNTLLWGSVAVAALLVGATVVILVAQTHGEMKAPGAKIEFR